MLATVLECAFMNTLNAQGSSQKLALYLGGGIEFGGDKIAEVYFTNGADQSVNAGQGGSVYAALEY